eukprot:jgi/Bigna1/92843/estExt_fgenesh1_pm.C_810004
MRLIDGKQIEKVETGASSEGPLKSVEEWQDYLEEKYAESENEKSEKGNWATNADKKKEEFRNYQDNPRFERVRNFYMENHKNQTHDFVLKMEKKYSRLNRMRMGVWEVLELLDTYIDDSDPDTNLSQLMHSLQTAEAVRKKYPGEKYDWYHLTGLIHDMGKFLGAVYGEKQWCVVGDTFPVGCRFSEKIEFSKFFSLNPDFYDEKMKTKLGVYKKNCGLKNVRMSYGHDEYLYQVCVQNKTTLPQQALYIIRYHSFYPWHKEGEYMYLCDDTDVRMLKWVKDFNQFDLYSKAAEIPNKKELIKYYKGLIDKYFPKVLNW